MDPGTAHAADLVGRNLGHYRVVSKLGSGGMGVVYEAEDLKLRRPVALKFLADDVASDPQWRERFLREARAASALNHSGICTIYEINEEGGRIFLAMELLRGKSLRQKIGHQPVPEAQLIAIAL